jgi:hypothetical protein
MLDMLKVSIEAILDLRLHVQTIAGFEGFRIDQAILTRFGLTHEWCLSLLLKLKMRSGQKIMGSCED